MKFKWLKQALLTFSTIVTVPHVSAQTYAYIDSPQGQYPVGTHSIDIVDHTRKPDPLAPEGKRQARKLHVKFWYPASRYARHRADYFPASGSYVEQFIEDARQQRPLSPEEVAELRTLNYLKSYAYNGVAIAKPQAWHFPNGWPVVLYSHGSNLHERDNTELLENLASHGYMVVSINHSYISGISEFKNGQTIIYNSEFDDLSDAFFEKDVPLQLTQDSVVVYQRLTLLNELLFDNTLDLDTVATVGFSLGGSNAVNVCLELHNCKAAVQIDGPQFGAAASTPLGKPLLLLESAVHRAKYNFSQALYDNQVQDVTLLTLNGTGHTDFFDLPRWLGPHYGGPDASHTHQITKSNILSFLNHYVAELNSYYDVSFPDAMMVQRK